VEVTADKKAKPEDRAFELPKRTFTTEFYVGVFSLIGMVCFGYLSINIAGMKIFKRGFYEVYTEFDNISGLKPGAQVEIAGVPVGEVSSINLDKTNAKVTMSIRDDVRLRQDDIVSVRTKGIIGDRYVKITPGGSEDLVPKGGRIEDSEPVMEFEDIIGKFIHKME